MGVLDIFIYESALFSLNLRQTLLDKPFLRFMGSIKIDFWGHKTHKNALKWVLGIFLDICILESAIFSLDLWQTLLYKPFLRFLGPIKRVFGPIRPIKMAFGDTLGHFYIWKCTFFIGSKADITWWTIFEVYGTPKNRSLGP